MMSVSMLVALVGLVALGVPIAIALILSAGAVLVLVGDFPLSLLGQKVYGTASEHTLLAVPLFLLAGHIMTHSGLSARILGFAAAVTGKFRGGLGMAGVGGSMVFAGMSGSATADTAAIGSMLVPAMEKRGHPRQIPAAIATVAGTMGVIIPPSIPLIIYGVVAGTSVTALFLGGIVPGVLIGLGLMITVHVQARLRGEVAPGFAGWRQTGAALRESALGLLAPVIILGGMFLGILTATEASAVAVVYAVLIGVLVYRTVRHRELSQAARDTIDTTGQLMLLLAGATLFAYVLTVDRIPDLLSGLLIDVSGGNKYVFLLLVNVLLLAAGMIIETLPAIFMLVPILSPVLPELGIDPIHFGLIFVINLVIGQVTPPSAPSLVIGAGIGRVSLQSLIRACTPLMLVEVAILLIVTYVPMTVLWLPGLLGY